MRRVWSGDCSAQIWDLRYLVDWINEIHCWGLTVHCPGCRNDIKTIMKSNTSGTRVSDIFVESEEGGGDGDA